MRRAGTVRGAWALAGLCACQGRGAEVVGQIGTGLAEGFEFVGYILLGFAAILALLYALVWWDCLRSLRRGRRPRVSATLLVAAHVLALLAAGDEPGGAAHLVLWWTAPVPALVFALAWGRTVVVRAPLFAAATAGMWLLPERPAPLTELPAPIVDVSASFMEACGRLADGQVVCAGFEVEGDPFARGPALVPGIADATEVQLRDGFGCALRAGGGAVCWSRADRWQEASPGRRVWPLPGGERATALAVGERQVLILSGEALRGWPHAPPEGLTTARMVTTADGLDTYFAALDLEGSVWVWRQEDATIEATLRIDDVPGVTAVALQEDGEVCMLVAGGAVQCMRFPDEHRPSFHDRIAEVQAAQIVAIDDPWDSFCAREAGGAVRCWSEHNPLRARVDLPGATALRSTGSALCDVGGRLRCVPSHEAIEDRLVQLLALPVRP